MKLDLASDINHGYETGLNYQKTDKFMLAIHWWSFGVIVLLSLTNSILHIGKYFPLAANYPSPLSWRVIPVPEALVALGIALLAALLPTLLINRFKNHYYWRLFISFTLSIFAYLGVFIAGGSIEMHFMFFAMIALVAIYADWRLGWFMLVLVGLHHTILNYLAPFWVFEYGRNDLAIIAHAIPVVITVIFTTIICNIHRNAIDQIQQVRTDLQDINKRLKSEEQHNHHA